MIKNINNCFTIPLMIIIIFSVGCFPDSALSANDLSDKLTISNVSYLPDITDNYSIAEIFETKHQSRKLLNDDMYFSGKLKNIWLAVTLSGGEIQPEEVILSSRFNFYNITCYYLDVKGNIVKKSDGYGVGDRDSLYRLPSFKIPLRGNGKYCLPD